MFESTTTIVELQKLPLKRTPPESIDGRQDLVFGRHSDKAETDTAPACLVGEKGQLRDLSVGLEQLHQVNFLNLFREISNKNSHDLAPFNFQSLL